MIVYIYFKQSETLAPLSKEIKFATGVFDTSDKISCEYRDPYDHDVHYVQYAKEKVSRINIVME